MGWGNWFALVGGAVLAGLLVAVGHWFPWVRRDRKIRNYVYGVSSISAGFTLWRLLGGDWQSVVGLAIIAVVAGGVVVLAYWIDELSQNVRQAKMAGGSDDELTE